MDESVFEPALPILSIVKRLAGERWHSVYERLLDITGEHRCVTPTRTIQEHLIDVVSELRITGYPVDASRLRDLGSLLTTFQSDANTLLVLLLCANIAEKKRRNFPQFVVDDIECSPTTTVSNTPTNVFTSIEDVEPNQRERETSTRFLTGIESANPRDCIADTAKCEHETYNFWLRHNLSPEGLSQVTATVSPRKPSSSAQTAEAGIETMIEANLADLDIGTSRGNNPWKKAPQAPPNERETCSDIMNDLVYKCISGPSIDELCDSETSPVPTLLFEASKDFGTHPTISRAQLMAQRHKIIFKLKAYREQLRARNFRRDVPSSTDRALACGLVYRSIVSFGTVYLCEKSSTTFKAVVSYVQSKADSYIGAVLQVADSSSSGLATLDLLLLDTAESLSAELWDIERTLQSIEGTDGSSESVLNVISDALRGFPYSQALQELFSHVTNRYEKVLRSWVMEGSCSLEERIPESESTRSSTMSIRETLNLTGRSVKTKDDALLKRSALFSENQALFLRRAGHGRAILRDLMVEENSSPKSSPEIVFLTKADQQHHPISQGFADAIDVKGCRGCASKKASRGIFIDILNSTSDDLQFVSDCSEEPLQGFFTSDEETFGYPQKKSCTSSEDIIPVHDNARADLCRVSTVAYPTLYAELAVGRYREVDEEVQRKIFECFVSDLEVFAHLEFIQKYILLGAGDFANALVEQMNAASLASESSETFLRNRKKAALTFYGSADAGKPKLRHLLHLARSFRTAMYLYNPSTEQFASQLELELSAGSEEFLATGELWDHRIDFMYTVPDPLKLIISEEAMSMYSEIHAFFLRVHRAKMSLRNLFMITRRQRVLGKMPSLSLLRNKRINVNLWLFCMNSEQFVNTIGGFFMDQVIGSAWETFKDVWESCESVWVFQEAHRRFLEGSMQRCLLDRRQKNLRKVISGGFDIIHKVEKEMMKIHESRSIVQVDVTTLQDLICSASASLRRRAVFLSDVLEKLFEAGSWHATSFMLW